MESTCAPRPSSTLLGFLLVTRNGRSAISMSAELAPDGRTGEHAERRRQVVIVDDDEDTREILCCLLGDAGYRVLPAASGEQALELMSSLSDPPELAIVDMIMPGMSGADVIRALRRSPKLSTVPVMVLSGGPRLDELAEGAGVAGWLNKPPSIGELLDLVAALTERN